jgi:DNA-binding transcriptional regulator YhcF (GntR family)
MSNIHSNSPLYAQIADQLRSNIRTEKWQEGERIPTEFDLCDIYHVSRIMSEQKELSSKNLVPILANIPLLSKGLLRN